MLAGIGIRLESTFARITHLWWVCEYCRARNVPLSSLCNFFFTKNDKSTALIVCDGCVKHFKQEMHCSNCEQRFMNVQDQTLHTAENAFMHLSQTISHDYSLHINCRAWKFCDMTLHADNQGLTLKLSRTSILN